MFMEVNNQGRSLFSNSQILLSTLLGGPFTAGNLLARNFRISGTSLYSFFARMAGIICTVIMYFGVVTGMEAMALRGFREEGFRDIMFKILFVWSFHLVYSGFCWFILKFRSFGQSGLPAGENREIFRYIIPGFVMTLIFILAGTFFFFFLMIYILPNVYIYNKVSRLFGSKSCRTIFLIFFLLLAFAFPAGEILLNSTGMGILKFYLLAGYFYLAFLLYFFLLLLASDLLIGLNRLIRFVPLSISGSRKTSIILVMFFMIISITIVVWGHINFNDTRINRFTIEIPRKTSKMAHLKIAMAADFHIYELTNTSFMDQFVDKINSINADIVLLPGDIVEDARDIPHMRYFEQKFRSVKSRYGIFASPGNHEHYGRSREKFDFFKDSGINLLNDSVVLIDHSFYLAGRSDDHEINRKSPGFLMNPVFDSLPAILLYHRPPGLDSLNQSKIDIQVSGHSHHGQMWPFNYITDMVYELPYGYGKLNNTHVFVTSGAQGWGPPVRVGGHSEIMEIDVNFK
jgi:predicted MPP superfamily phosphohydrolase